MKRIILTGGGTAGHVTPNIALIPTLAKRGWDIHYIGSYNGIEKRLLNKLGIPYHAIASGKLRRYFDIKNLTDPFKVIKGTSQAFKCIRKLKPNVVFSKGGFVSVPVIIAAKLSGVPSIVHESDMTPGLANKLSIPFTTKVCTTFSETLKHLPSNKSILTGTPIRQEILNGNEARGYHLCNFTSDKPVLLMIGGSSGSVRINQVLRSALDMLLQHFQIVHLCGKGNLNDDLKDKKGYKQFEYVTEQLADLFAMSDVVISRAGANAIYELLALRKPNVLIPLPLSASRGDQILNARSFEKHGYSMVLEENQMNKTSLVESALKALKSKQHYIDKMDKSELKNGIGNVLTVIERNAKYL